jgi:hypothetical protein
MASAIENPVSRSTFGHSGVLPGAGRQADPGSLSSAAGRVRDADRQLRLG